VWNRRKTQQGMRVIWAYGRRHVLVLVQGILASIGVVLFRLAMPWPLRGIVEIIFQDPSRKSSFLVDILPSYGDPALWFGGAYLVFAAGAGTVELVQRVAMKRFAAQAVHDMRGAAACGALHWQNRGGAPAELIARVIGDSARIKAGLSGILVHGFQNGLLYIGVSILLLILSPHLAIFFLGAGALAILIGLRASAPVAASAQKHRRKESAYAVAVHEAMETGTADASSARLNTSSARKDVETTRLVSLSTLLVHIALAATLGSGLWFGCTRVKAGFSEPGELFLFVAYTLTVHRRMVQVGRQFARGGKVLACAIRVGQLIPKNGKTSAASRVYGPLESNIRLQRVRLDSLRSKANKPRLRSCDVTIQAGTRVAVLGPMGSGKSSLLRILAGVEHPSKGTISWDDVRILHYDDKLNQQVGFLPHAPVFSPQPLWRILGLSGPQVTVPKETELVCRELGLDKFVRRLPKGMREKIASATISPTEARSLRLASILTGPDSVWVLDDPLTSAASKKKALRRLETIFTQAKGRTVIMAVSSSRVLTRFDRVLVLRRGRIVFDGTPDEWKEAGNAGPDSRGRPG